MRYVLLVLCLAWFTQARESDQSVSRQPGISSCFQPEQKCRLKTNLQNTLKNQEKKQQIKRRVLPTQRQPGSQSHELRFPAHGQS